MNKEEILSKNASVPKPQREGTFDAMDEYAKQEAIGFAEWMTKNYDAHFPILGGAVHHWTYKGLMGGEQYTTDQLYTIFKNQKGK